MNESYDNVVWSLVPEEKYTSPLQFVIFKPLNYCFKETIGINVKASFTSRP